MPNGPAWSAGCPGSGRCCSTAGRIGDLYVDLGAVEGCLTWDWTLATVQIDYHQPEQFELEYVSAGSGRKRPVMVHRSLVGSMERLFGHLIEVHDGAFPVWYAPVQLAVLPVGADQDTAAAEFVASAGDLRVRVVHDGSVGARIRDNRKVPYIAVIGPREASSGEVALRLRDGSRLEPMPRAAAIDLIRAARDKRQAAVDVRARP